MHQTLKKLRCSFVLFFVDPHEYKDQLDDVHFVNLTATSHRPVVLSDQSLIFSALQRLNPFADRLQLDILVMPSNSMPNFPYHSTWFYLKVHVHVKFYWTTQQIFLNFEYQPKFVVIVGNRV